MRVVREGCKCFGFFGLKVIGVEEFLGRGKLVRVFRRDIGGIDSICYIFI